jgi:hypothetical protein
LQAECCAKGFLRYGYATCTSGTVTGKTSPTPAAKSGSSSGGKTTAAASPAAATCFKRSSSSPYQLCDPEGCQASSKSQLPTFAACCKSWNNTQYSVPKGDGVKDQRCFPPPGAFEAPCWTPYDQDISLKKCFLNTEAARCLTSGKAYSTEVRRSQLPRCQQALIDSVAATSAAGHHARRGDAAGHAPPAA